jgi:hypothetical protein
MFQAKVVEKFKTHILCAITFFENRAVYGSLEKYGTARQATNNNIIRLMGFACWITKVTGTQ